MSGKKVLIGVNQLLDRPAPYLQRLRDAGFNLEINDHGRLMHEDELIAALPGVVATVAGGEIYSERVFAAAPDLKVVARCGVGYDRVDVEAATRHGVAVAMAFGSNHESVADYAFGMVMALGLDMLNHDRTVTERRWGGSFHHGVWGRTLGLLGFGRIGRAVARRGAGFGMRVIAHDPVVDAVVFEQLGVEWLPFDAVLRQADFVSMHMPLLPETHHVIGARELALMKPTAFLINTARGGQIDENALVEALRAGTIAGAGLDVFAAEPPAADHPLLDADNVVFSPHVAGMDEAGERLMIEACIDNILSLLDGRDPQGGRLLNPAVLPAAHQPA